MSSTGTQEQTTQSHLSSVPTNPSKGSSTERDTLLNTQLIPTHAPNSLYTAQVAGLPLISESVPTEAFTPQTKQAKTRSPKRKSKGTALPTSGSPIVGKRDGDNTFILMRPRVKVNLTPTPPNEQMERSFETYSVTPTRLKSKETILGDQTDLMSEKDIQQLPPKIMFLGTNAPQATGMLPCISVQYKVEEEPIIVRTVLKSTPEIAFPRLFILDQYCTKSCPASSPVTYNEFFDLLGDIPEGMLNEVNGAVLEKNPLARINYEPAINTYYNGMKLLSGSTFVSSSDAVLALKLCIQRVFNVITAQHNRALNTTSYFRCSKKYVEPANREYEKAIGAFFCDFSLNEGECEWRAHLEMDKTSKYYFSEISPLCSHSPKCFTGKSYNGADLIIRTKDNVDI